MDQSSVLRFWKTHSIQEFANTNTNIEHDISKTAVLEFSHTAISRNSQKFTLKEFGGELVLSQNL